MINNWRLIRSDFKLILKLALVAFVNNLIYAAIFALEFQMIGISVGYIQYVFVSVFSGFALFLSITPGSLGIKELFAVFSATLIGVTSVEMVTTSIIDRLITFLVLLIAGSVSSYFLFRKKKAD